MNTLPINTLFDSHCHFDFADFDDQRESIWQACHQARVRNLLIPGVAPQQWVKAAQMAEELDGVYFSVGLHPWWIKERIDSAQFLAQLEATSDHERCVAIGECGLDAFIETPLAEQMVYLEQQLLFAKNRQMPVILHCRKAHNELIEMLKKIHLPRGGVLHAFSGSVEQAQQYWRMGVYLGVGGVITYPRANKTRVAVQQMPLESLLLETDAPDMPLNGKKGQANSPLFLPLIAQALADLRAEPVENIAEQTSKNAKKLFGISV